MQEEKQDPPINEWEIDTLPNRLTLLRIILIPIIIGSLLLILTDFGKEENRTFFLGHFAAFFFIIASITDFFDGYIARKRKLITVFGSFLDPMADKFLVISCLIMLEGLNRLHPFLVIILVLREVYIMGLRLLATERGHIIPVDNFGKWKTASQMLAIPCLMAYDEFAGISLPLIGNILTIIAAILSLYSAGNYSLHLFFKMKQERQRKKEEKKLQKKLKKESKDI